MAEEDTEDTPPAELSASEEKPDTEGTEEAESTELPELPLEAVVEAILFAATEPLKLSTIAKAVGKGTRQDAILKAINTLNVAYLETGRAFEIAETAGRWQFMSRPEYYQYIARVRYKDNKPQTRRPYSPAVMETLAVVAYKQPVTRGDIQSIRGVDPGPALSTLVERGLVATKGRRTDAVGQPMLYGTTDAFLIEFGMGSLDELPMRSEILLALPDISPLPPPDQEQKQ